MSLQNTCPEPLAVMAGMRTPFAKAFGALASVPADELGRVALTGALDRVGFKPSDVDEVIFGNVASPPDTANISRVIALKAGVPQDRVAHTVHRNCASGMEAIVSAWQSIREGRAEVVVAGGTESMSNVPLLWDSRMKDL
ncbi:MAG: acetyl-CoA C-acyltransferase, partial [Candidatus Saccharimonas sp.]|nr:acetyl-CoA C-acyltransferase [Planctomycetaceae bacterium]